MLLQTYELKLTLIVPATFAGVEVSSDSVNVENFFLIIVIEAMDAMDGLT